MIEFSSLSDTIVEECAERLRCGATVDECLSKYPALAQELEPLLHTMIQVSRISVPQLRPEVRARVRRQMLQAVHNRYRTSASRRWFNSPLLRVALVFVTAFFALSTGLVAAQTSLPDTPLYAVKRGSENLRLQFTSDPTARAELYLHYSETRFNEIVALSTDGRPIPQSLLDACTAQGDLALQGIARLDPSAATPLYQRYVLITERRITILSTDVRIHPSAKGPALDQFVQHEQAALQTAKQHPLGTSDKPVPSTEKPHATEPAPQPNLTPTPPNARQPEKPTTKPVEPKDGKHVDPTLKPANQKPENGNNGNPTPQPDNGNNGNNGNNSNPTPQPDNGNNGNNGNSTPQPDNGNNGNNGNPATQPDNGNPGNPDNNGNLTNKPAQENDGNNGKGGKP